jgi:hypothetical protein
MIYDLRFKNAALPHFCFEVQSVKIENIQKKVNFSSI